MRRSSPTAERISQARARGAWLRAQRLVTAAAFGRGPAAAQAAIEHLGYVLIDTIHVIERSHHHILYTRIPSYERRDLQHLQSEAKSVFEYWTHALSYLPLRDYRFFRRDMVEIRIAHPDAGTPRSRGRSWPRSCA